MLISDWSSDVCSSVLLEPGENELGPGVDREIIVDGHEAEKIGNGRYAVKTPATEHDPRDLVFAGRRREPVGFEPEGAAGADDEIGIGEVGRASCRERVCQSV